MGVTAIDAKLLAPPVESRRARRLCFTGYFILGLTVSLLGPAFPALSTRLGANLGDMGLVFTFNFLGFLVMTLVAGPLLDRFGRRPVLVAGLGLLTLGLAGLLLAPALSFALGAMLVLGLGLGTAVVAMNVTVSDLSPDNRPAALNMLNVFWGIGSLIGPATMGLALQLSSERLAFGLTMALVVLLGAAVATQRLPTAPDGVATSGSGAPIRVYTQPLLWVLGLILFFQGGIEIGMGGWTFTYAREALAMSVPAAAVMTSWFWVAATAGRLMGAIMLARYRLEQVLLWWIGSAILGSLLLVFAPGLLAGITGLFLLGLGEAPIWSSLVAIGTTRFPSAAGAAAGLVIAVGGVGNTVIPWAQGKLMASAGPAWGMAVILVSSLAMLGLYPVFGGLDRRSLRGSGAKAAAAPTGLT